MARLLLLHQAAEADRAGAPTPLVLVILMVAAAVVATVIVSLCTSSRNANPGRQRGPAPRPRDEEDSAGSRGGAGRQLLASLSGIGGKAAVAKLVSWKRRSPPPAAQWSSDDDDEGAVVAEEEGALWKKTIVMGDKCRPLQFSGHIAYDSDGNLLPLPAETVKKDPAGAAMNQQTS